MENIIFVAIILNILLYSGYRVYKKINTQNREVYIDNYKFPKKISETLLTTYPQLKENDLNLIIKGLKEYFYICNIAGKTMVAMPSQVVDVAWHDFILFTREYESFCEQALGRFLHHTPVESMSSKILARDSIKLAWKISCERENIDINTPIKLPLLFALDSILNIENGFKYSLDCSSKSAAGYCAGHIGCSSGCGGDSGNSSTGDSGCGGGCGGGD